MSDFLGFDTKKCTPENLPPELILSLPELQKLMCIVIANVEYIRQAMIAFRKLQEDLEVHRGAGSAVASGPEAMLYQLFLQNMNKKQDSEEVPQFTDKEIEDIQKTLDKLKENLSKQNEEKKST
jgi:prefoldin subunit 5